MYTSEKCINFDFISSHIAVTWDEFLMHLSDRLLNCAMRPIWSFIDAHTRTQHNILNYINIYIKRRFKWYFASKTKYLHFILISPHFACILYWVFFFIRETKHIYLMTHILNQTRTVTMCVYWVNIKILRNCINQIDSPLSQQTFFLSFVERQKTRTARQFPLPRIIYTQIGITGAKLIATFYD